jgi:hypothetical protein
MKSYPVAMTIADEGTTVTKTDIPVSGKLRGIVINPMPAITGTSLTITVKDKNGVTVFTKAI